MFDSRGTDESSVDCRNQNTESARPAGRARSRKPAINILVLDAPPQSLDEEWLRLGRFIGNTPAIVEKYSSHSTYRPA
jgi:hypothetical protein